MHGENYTPTDLSVQNQLAHKIYIRPGIGRDIAVFELFFYFR